MNKKKILILIVVILIVAILIGLWVCSNSKTVGTDLQEETNLLEYISSGLEVPAPVENHQIIHHTGYVLSYNEEYEVADWVAYEFTNEELNASVAQRKDNFREDKAAFTGSAQLSDYKNSGYSRGHLAPAADFRWSDQAMSDTFYLSNMTPQKQNNFNAGIWLKAEDFVREVCRQNQVVFVVTGPVLTDGPYETIGSNKVAVPKNFYKVLLSVSDDGSWCSYAMVIPQNADKNAALSDFMCTINDVEELTGLDFFMMLEDSLEEQIESFMYVKEGSL